MSSRCFINDGVYIVDHQMHDGLGHEIPDTLVDDGHVGVHQVTDGLHLSLQLRVHGEVIRRGSGLTLNLWRMKQFQMR